MKVYTVKDAEFCAYGRVLASGNDVHIAAFLDVLSQVPITEEVVYKANEPLLENLADSLWMRDAVYGEMPIQVGWCSGHNNKLNAMEYHKASEVNLAATDMVLMLGRLQDVDIRFQYNTGKVQLFFVPKGTMIEVYGTTLHYAPCNTEPGGFCSMVVLPKGTNTALESNHAATGEERLILAKNKWLIGHPEAELPDESDRGLIGENIILY